MKTNDVKADDKSTTSVKNTGTTISTKDILSEFYIDNYNNLIECKKHGFNNDYLEALNNVKYSNLKYEIFKYSNMFADSIKVNTAALKTQATNLIKAYEEENLVLVMGAGVSMPFKVPDWNSLLRKLLFEVHSSGQDEMSSMITTTLYSSFFPNSPLTLARYIQEIYQNEKMKQSFEKTVRKLLYESIDRDAKSEIMDEVVQLCISPGKSPNLDSIITYNYDDIIEQAVSKKSLEVPIKPIYFTGMNPQNGELPIYHVHGYLPEEGIISEKHVITLSESIYHQQYLDIYSWSNIVQINKFSGKICLLIGSSFSDPNLRRLMDIGKQQRGSDGGKHYIIKKRINYMDVEKTLEELLVKDRDLMNMKENEGVGLGDLVKNLIRMNQRLEEKDAQSFGAEIIWVNDYEKEIPQLLASIRHRKAISKFI